MGEETIRVLVVYTVADGPNALPANPVCAVEGCREGSFVLAGMREDDEHPGEWPVYRCGAGHLTQLIEQRAVLNDA